jgi:hypothetical protein
MGWVTSAVALVVVWAMIGGGLSAYIRWCFRFDRSRMWREALRRAGLAPLMLVGVEVSQWAANLVETPIDRNSLLMGLIIAWLVPPVITLIKHVRAAPNAVPVHPTVSPPTDARPISTGVAIAILVVSSIVSVGPWYLFRISRAPAAWVGSMGMLSPFVILATLLLLTRRAERSGHGAQSRHLGFLWAIGMASLAIQVTAMAATMSIVTLTLVIGVTGMLLMSGGMLAFLVRSGRSRS